MIDCKPPFGMNCGRDCFYECQDARRRVWHNNPLTSEAFEKGMEEFTPKRPDWYGKSAIIPVPWTIKAADDAIRAGHAEGPIILIDGKVVSPVLNSPHDAPAARPDSGDPPARD